MAEEQVVIDPNTSPIRAFTERLGIPWKEAKEMPAKALTALIAAYSKGYEDGLQKRDRYAR